MSDLLLLWRLFLNYLDAWPFVLAHGAVLILALSALRDVSREQTALDSWRVDPSAAVRSRSLIATILNSFVRECERDGPRGTFIPMTDYSDRIDAIVDGLISSIHDRVNMFLVVGIAGTLFGVFQFTASTWSSDKVKAVDVVGTLLPQAMAKAFPVGFVGLLLMLMFQAIATRVENRLHTAVAEGTRLALAYRDEVTGAAGAEGLELVTRRIEVAMAPVAGLQQTLRETLAPVVEQLAERLDTTLSLVTTEFQVLNATTTAFNTSVDGLRTTVARVHETAGELRDLLQTAPKVLRQSAKLQEQQEALLHRSSVIFEQSVTTAKHVAEVITDVNERLTALPTTIVEATKTTVDTIFTDVGLSSEEYWRQSFSTLRGDVQKELTAYLHDLEPIVDGASQSLRSAAEEMDRLAQQSGALMTGPVTQAVKDAKNEIADLLGRIDELFRKNIPSAQRQLAELEQSARSATDKLIKQRESTIVPSGIPNYDRLIRCVEEQTSLLRSIHSDLPKRKSNVFVRAWGAASRTRITWPAWLRWG